MVTVDGNPTDAVIEVHSATKGREIFTVHTPGIKGAFKTKLPSGDDYDITVKVNKFPHQVLTVHAKQISSEEVLNVFADFTSPAYDHKLEDLKKANEKHYSNSENMTFAKRFGNSKKENLRYKVQIGAFKFFENFDYSRVIGLPRIIRKTDADFITRFTMGDFETYNEALDLLKTLMKRDMKESFIVAYLNNERKQLDELIKEKIL